MQLKKVALAETHAFTPFFLDYVNKKESLKPFYGRFPTVENFKDQIAEKQKSFPSKNRETLAEVLQKQYKHITQSDPVKRNLQSLKDKNTFTITTGHQLNIFTGPLYFIYKIVTVINTCRRLSAAYPEYNFVPVYWMASEDHDYDEIKYFRLYGKKYVWETKQSGAVGRFETRDFDSLLNSVPGEFSVFRDAYLKNKTLNDAVRYYVNELFGNEGVIVLDADDRALKAMFRPVMKEDIVKNKTVEIVHETNARLEALHYETQIFCRDINFFYLDAGIRSRIEKENGKYRVIDSSLTFSEAEIEKMIDSEPEKFSPNVILRPLYEEVILPNLGYVGGPAEVVYWLQLKTVFDHHHIPFPILLPRNFAMVVEAPVLRKLEKTGLSLVQLFEDKNYLFNEWTVKNSKHNLTLGKERDTIQEIYEELKQRAGSIDQTLVPFVGAEGKRVMNSLEKIEHKMLRAEKRQQSDKLRQIEEVKDALFPNGALQERVDNFLNFYQKDPEFISKLITYFDPFDFRLHILTY